ncbi:hypothetical protein BDV95DRAFT_627972 [Massariosphaeria phaeospora]|uniref:Phosphatidylethanolamine-binding protein n=1 Tax=Massariosphaeria phaeospora TaxID=100035 RepID=A0A7C8IAB0_9PLEO|nr:hypothetical protein BDV95DRAFT_627972 [Massariosphaeria phaeospora]
MLSKIFRRAALAAAVVQVAIAQSTIPQDLSSVFSTSTDVQVSFTGEAQNGFQDGTEFSKEEVAQVPEFALGDSSGISTSARYTILMVDTTCDDARKLHYAKANFQVSQGVKIESEAEPALTYAAPGSFGETGDDRKYTFLMYNHPRQAEVSDLKLPEGDEAFDAKKFQDDNGFKDPVAGLGMVVKLGGQSSCDGSSSNPTLDTPESSSAAVSSAAPSATPSATPSAAPSATPSVSPSAEPTSSVVASATDAPEAPASTPEASQPPAGEEDTPSASGSVRKPAVATSVVQSNGPSSPSSTVFLTSVQPDAPIASGNATTPTRPTPAEQTVNAASALSLGATVLVPVMAFAGFFAW